MAKRTCSFRTAAIYHNLAALAALVCGTILLVQAIKFAKLGQAAGPGGDAQVRRRVFRARFVHFAEAALLLAFGLTSALAARKRCVGVTFRAVFLVAAAAIAAWTAVRAVTGALAMARAPGDPSVHGALEALYNGSVAGPAPAPGAGAGNSTSSSSLGARVCELEALLDCRGLDRGDCDDCVAGRYNATCRAPAHCFDCAKFPAPHGAPAPPAPPRKPGEKAVSCFDRAVQSRVVFERTRTIVSIVVLVVVLIDIFLSCRFPVHVGELLRGDEEFDVAPEEMDVTA